MHAHEYSWREFSLAVVNVSYSLYAFGTTKEEFEMEKGLVIASDTLSRIKLVGPGDMESAFQPPGEKLKSERGRCNIKTKGSVLMSIGIWHIFAMPYVWTIATFLGLYQGAETIAQGFIVTFLLHERVN